MSNQYLRGNEEREQKRTSQQASLFAQQVLGRVGGSCVYIEPKKAKKFIDTDDVK